MNLTGIILHGALPAAGILLAGCTGPGPPDAFSTTTIREKKTAAPPAVARPAPPAEPVAKEIEPFVPFGTLDEHLKSIKLTNGIGPREASILATAYFTRYDGLCGAVGYMRRDPAAWRISTMVGYSGAPGDDILIDVCTGAISQKNHSTIHPPWNELRVIEEAYNQRMAP